MIGLLDLLPIDNFCVSVKSVTRIHLTSNQLTTDT